MSYLCRAIPIALQSILLAIAVFFTPVAVAAEPPATCKIGAHVTSLYDIDTAAGTFSAEAWIWTLCPNLRQSPLKSVETTNASKAETTLYSVTPRPQGRWEQHKLIGRFRHDYDLRLFPFDRHRLVIGLEEGVLDATGLRYRFDAANSGLSPDIHIDGWRIAGFAGKVGTARYATNFGDPALPPGSEARYAHLDLITMLVRDDAGSFLKLTVPVYISALLALLTLLMHVESGRNLLNPRIALLAGLLFAVVFNLRGIDDIVGQTTALTLMDIVHFIALILILVATLAAVVAGRLIDKGFTIEQLRAIDRRVFGWSTASYVSINIALVAAAILASELRFFE